MMMNFLKRQRGLVAGVGLALVGIVCVGSQVGSRVDAQNPSFLVLGNNSGTARPLAVDASGNLVLAGFTATAADPCLNPNVAKSSVAVTATGQQVALSGATVIYVCGLYATLGGTTPTAQVQYGTGSNCGTGTVSLSGAFAPAPNGTVLMLDGAGTIAKTAAGNALCVTLAGTSPTIAGLLSYVQQ